MVRSFRRGALAAVLALSLAPLAACAAGNGAPTLEVTPDNAQGAKDGVRVQNAWVLTQTSGPATVSARLFNNTTSAQTLQAVQVGSLTATLAGSGGDQGVTVPAGSSVLLGGKGNPSAVLDDGSSSLQDGGVQNAVFVFSSTGAVPVTVNITPAAGFFESYGPSSIATTPPPSPTATPTTPSPTATPTGTATPTDTTTTSTATPTS